MRKKSSIILSVYLILTLLVPASRAYTEESSSSPVYPTPQSSDATLQEKVSDSFGKTTSFLKNMFRLKPVRPKNEETERDPSWVWSPSQGQFVPPSAAEDQRTAEEVYTNALKLRESNEDLNKIIREFRYVVRTYPNSAYAPEAQFLLALTFEEHGKLTRAAVEYQKLLKDFPRSERINEATERLFKIGTLFQSGEKQKVIGVALIPLQSKAADIFNFIIQHEPFGPFGDQAQLQLGITYRKMGRFEDAVKAFEALIANYPTSPLIDDAHYQLAETSYEHSQNVIRDQRTSQQATTHLKDFIKKHASSSLTERARILKQQLDEQDAEKNYRIGLYYEKQGFIESATIYYEDVSERYKQTEYGKKAAERLKNIDEPVRAMQKGEEAVERRLEEVRSMLEALKQEEKKQKTGTPGVGDVAKTSQELTAELATLTIAQKRFQEESEENFDARRKTYRERQKNLKEKFKIFKSRKKLLKSNPSPELEEIFSRWEMSLINEQDELAKERATLRSLGLELKESGVPWFGWVPFFGASKDTSPDEVVQFGEKKWAKLDERKAKIGQKRKASESELEKLVLEIASLDEQEFIIAKSTPKFQELLPNGFKTTKANLEKNGIALDGQVKSFEAGKQDYATRYGNDFLKTLALDPAAADTTVSVLVAKGADLKQELEKLKNEKAALSDAWLKRKERLDTLAQAFGSSRMPAAENEPTFTRGVSPEERAKQARMLKKRIKYVEREIRSRMDEIQDWQHENAKRIDQLEQLLHPGKKSLSFGERTGKLLSPATGTYKLAKAFFVGLPNRERELVEEAKAKVAAKDVALTGEQLQAVRELNEEIELQSILIQGRANEVKELEGRLADLQTQAKQIPGFNYQSMLIERFPTELQYSLESARTLLGEEGGEAAFAEQVNRQTEELKSLEKSVLETSTKIEALSKAQQAKNPAGSRSSGASIPSILPDILGDAETTPTTAGSAGEAAPDAERVQFETKLVQMRDQINKNGTKHREDSAAYEKTLRDWYRGDVRAKIIPEFPKEHKPVLEQKKNLVSKQVEIQKALKELIEEEYGIVESQRDFLDQKLTELDKRLKKTRKPSRTLSDVLSNEIKVTTRMRDTLVRESAFLESSLKK